MAHGYAKAEGKPMLALLHGTIGIQHGGMSIYQAYYDRVPVVMIAGNDADFIPAHTAHDMAGMVRSYTKWDAEPKTIDEALVAIQRAYNEAITPPMGPTLVVMGSEVQKDNAPNAKVPAYKPPTFTDHRRHARAGNRKRPGGGSEPQNRGRTFTNARRRSAGRGTGRAGGSVHQHDSDQRADEFPATSSSLRPGRGHHLRLHAWVWKRAAHRLPSPVRRWRKRLRRETPFTSASVVRCPGRQRWQRRRQRRQRRGFGASHRGRCRGEPSAADRRSEAPADRGPKEPDSGA